MAECCEDMNSKMVLSASMDIYINQYIADLLCSVLLPRDAL